MTVKKESASLVGSKQVEAMQQLTLPATAWLLGISPRSLRDQVDLPRDAKGRYDAQDAIAWARKRVKRPELADDEIEQLLVISEELGSDASHLVAAHDCLVDVRARHGEHGLLVFVDLLIDTWAELAKLDRAASGPATSPQERLAEWQRREQQQLARRELKIAHVCEGCGKVRLGRRWVKGKPRPGYVAMSDLCPECDAKTIASP